MSFPGKGGSNELPGCARSQRPRLVWSCILVSGQILSSPVGSSSTLPSHINLLGINKPGITLKTLSFGKR